MTQHITPPDDWDRMVYLDDGSTEAYCYYCDALVATMWGSVAYSPHTGDECRPFLRKKKKQGGYD